jgi:zinc protease
MNTKKSFALAGLVLALSFSAYAQTSARPAATASPAKAAAPANAAALPSADQILDHYLQASGGRDAWKKLTTRVSKGTIDVPAMNMSGTLELTEKAPNLTLAVVSIGGAAFRQAFDGKVGWSDDPQNGLRELSGDELEETRRDADFAHPVNLHSLYKTFTVTGAEKIDDASVYVVEATPEVGGMEKMYFDAQTGLLVRTISQRHTPDGVSSIQIDLSDYRDVDGVKLPFSVHQAAGETAFTMKFEEVHHNVDVDNAQFAKPAAQ